MSSSTAYSNETFAMETRPEHELQARPDVRLNAQDNALQALQVGIDAQGNAMQALEARLDARLNDMQALTDRHEAWLKAMQGQGDGHDARLNAMQALWVKDRMESATTNQSVCACTCLHSACPPSEPCDMTPRPVPCTAGARRRTLC